MRSLFFDLDGTLTDPSEGIFHSIGYALREMGRKPVPDTLLRRFIGPPLVPSFKEFLGMTEEEALTALRLYRVYFAERGMFENRPYDGIGPTLAALRDRGYLLAVATSKPEPFARRILERFELAQYFTEISGASMDESLNTKEAVLRQLLGRLADAGQVCTTPEKVARGASMIGDRRHDAEGAAACGIPTVGVLWGFGSREELQAAGCLALAGSMDELLACFPGTA